MLKFAGEYVDKLGILYVFVYSSIVRWELIMKNSIQNSLSKDVFLLQQSAGIAKKKKVLFNNSSCKYRIFKFSERLNF